MYKAIVVDDEYYIREGISEEIDWKQHNVEIIGKCSGVHSAERLVKSEHVDIVITDIEMADTTGLEFAEKLVRDYPHIKIIIISGYDYYDYMKKAISIKVTDYILKPIITEKLVNAVLKAIGELEQELSRAEHMVKLEKLVTNSNKILHKVFVEDLINGRITSREEFLERQENCHFKLFDNFGFCVRILVEDQNSAFNEREKEFLSVIKTCFERHFQVYPYTEGMGQYILIIASQFSGKTQYKKAYEKLMKLKSMLAAIYKIPIVFGIGDTFGNFSEIQRSYQEAKKASDSKILYGNNSIISYFDIVERGKEYILPFEIERKIQRSLEEQDVARLKDNIVELAKFFVQHKYCLEQIKVSLTLVAATIAMYYMQSGVDFYTLDTPISVIDLCLFPEQFGTIENIRDNLLQLIDVASGKTEFNQDKKVKKYIMSACEYIKLHFGDPSMSINTVAQYIGFSVSHFSKVFKNEVGEAYSDYVAKIRIKEAKRLLHDTTWSLEIIGNRVGYMNLPYFCTMFKNKTGQTPSEFRDTNR